jgi:hypothetical protein
MDAQVLQRYSLDASVQKKMHLNLAFVAVVIEKSRSLDIIRL